MWHAIDAYCGTSFSLYVLVVGSEFYRNTFMLSVYVCMSMKI